MSAIPGADADDALERGLTREILRSEQRRVIALLALLGAMLGGWALAFAVWRDSFALVSQGRASLWAPIAFFTPFVLYELGMLALFRRRLRQDGELPDWVRYLQAAIEVTMPTVAMLAAADVVGDPVSAVGGWFVLVYALVIVTATLRLNRYLPMFTGAMAAVQYYAAAAWLLPLSALTTESVLTPAYHLGKAAVLVLIGLAAGLVAREMRHGFRRVQRLSAARDHVTNLFGQHVSPAVVERLLAQDPNSPVERQEVCVMFLDIRNFTAAAGAHAPEETVGYLNALFAFMIEAVDRHGGIVNKFLGDGFMAVFGAPLPDAGAARQAVAAAREILRETGQRNRAGAIWPTRIGIGIAAGPAVTGSVGSPRRKEFTIIGSVVNLAARLEELTKTLDGAILVDSTVAAALGDDAGVRSLGEHRIRGFDAPVTVWAVA